MELSIAARDALEGKVNRAQKEKDLTLTEKMDGECATMIEVKKVLSASFERKGDQHVRNSWVSSLRTLTDGCGDATRTTCCEKMEETVSSPMLSPNKRTLLNQKSGSIVALRNERVRSSVPDPIKKNTTAGSLMAGRDFITECN